MNDLEALQEIVQWWRLRGNPLIRTKTLRRRVTYYVTPHLIDAIRQEAATTGETQADVVERALTIYFVGKRSNP